MVPKAGFLALGLVVGLLVGAAGLSVITPTTSETSPTVATSTATGCVLDDRRRPGWVGQVLTDDSRVVALNITMYHESPGLELSTKLQEPSEGNFQLAITTARPTERVQVPDDCQPRTTYLVSLSLPADYRILAVTVDGQRRVAIFPSDSSPTFRPLNTTIRAS